MNAHTPPHHTDDSKVVHQQLLVSATGIAKDARRLRDEIIARNIELPEVLATLLLSLADQTALLRDAIHDAGLDPSDTTAHRQN